MATGESETADRASDRDRPPTPESVEEVEALSYSEKQSLAGAHGYGRIIGVQATELENYLVDELDLRDGPANSEKQSENSERSTEIEEPGQSEDSETSVGSIDDREAESDVGDSEVERGTQTVSKSSESNESTEQQTDAIEVGHEGSEKLSPEGAPDDRGTAVAPPSGIEADQIDRDALEGEPEQSEHGAVANGQENSERSGKPDEPGQSDDSENSGNDGGLLSRIKGGSDRSPDEIVEDADSEEERARREEVRSQFSDAFGSDGDEGDRADDVDDDQDSTSASSHSDPTPSTSRTQGMVVDDSVVQHLIGMPFSMAASTTGWDGWELSKQEKAANAELFLAMCDEHDVDPSATTMFAISMATTVGGRAVRYRQQRGSDDVDEHAGEVEDVQEESETFDDDVVDVRGDDGRERRGGRPDHAGDPTPQEDSLSDSFNFEDPDTW